MSVDDRVVVRAKQFAKKRGASVSSLVEAYLTGISEPPRAGTFRAPILRSLRGILKNGDIEDYRKHLGAKYR